MSDELVKAGTGIALIGGGLYLAERALRGRPRARRAAPPRPGLFRPRVDLRAATKAELRQDLRFFRRQLRQAQGRGDARLAKESSEDMRVIQRELDTRGR